MFGLAELLRFEEPAQIILKVRLGEHGILLALREVLVHHPDACLKKAADR